MDIEARLRADAGVLAAQMARINFDHLIARIMAAVDTTETTGTFGTKLANSPDM